MLLSSRSLRRVVLGLLCMVSSVCAAQSNQFRNLASVQPVGGRVLSFLTGTFQSPPGGTDLLYVSAPVGSGAASSIMAGELLNQNGAGFANLGENQIVFTGVSNVVAAEGSFLGTGSAYAFTLTSSTGGPVKLCLYGATGATVASRSSSYSGGNAYPPTSGSSGCMTLLNAPGAVNPPQIGYMAAFPYKAGQSMGLIVEDTANSDLYVLSFSGASVSNGVLGGVVAVSTIPLAPADGPGPIYVGDFNGDGNMDFIVNGQTGYSATVYLGNGNGTFQMPMRYPFAGVRSMLMQDMDGDKVADMVVENNSGAIEIHHGNGDGTFATASEGGTGAGSALAGDGGHLAAINPHTLDILTTTPIGLSLLRSPTGTLNYALNTIYNIGPGRSSFVLVDFYGTGNLDLAVDSAEGVAILTGNPDGTFVASSAYSALAPGLGAVVGQFRNQNNPNGNVDAVVGTGATQAQLLTGNGDGTFNTFSGVANSFVSLTNVAASLWSNILTGDFNGDGIPDIEYSLTGLPVPAPSAGGPGVYLQLGNGDGTFQRWFGVGGSGNNTLYGESAVGDFNGDGVSDFANIDAAYDNTLISQRVGGYLSLA